MALKARKEIADYIKIHKNGKSDIQINGSPTFAHSKVPYYNFMLYEHLFMQLYSFAYRINLQCYTEG